ncbi:MAG TPA: S9 family peptidase [Bryobacteraceae bacterium]|jgi:dipeptidyl aminopeptidase/acylaminoacyl peptidase
MRSCLLLWLLAIPLLAQKTPFDAAAMMQLKRISDPQISPDGKTVAFVVQSVDLDANKKPKQIYSVPIEGGTPKQLTITGEANDRPRWSRDGKIFFISDRAGTPEIWRMDADGGNAKQITFLSTGAGGVLPSPDGKMLVFTSDVFPSCGADESCNKKMLDDQKASKVKARLINSLLYRHWNAWQSPTRSHLLSIPIDGGTAIDLTPGSHDVPPFSLGGPDDYAISPDGKEVCFTMNTDEVAATSTNNDLFVVGTNGENVVNPRRITPNVASDSSPQYSPDGKYIAYRSQNRAGYESDRQRLMVLERATGHLNSLTDNLDRSVNSFTWLPDSSRLFFTVIDRGRQGIQTIPVAGGALRVVATGNSTLDDMVFTSDGKTLVFTRQSGSFPPEIARASSGGGAPVPLTHLNDDVLGSHQLTSLEELFTDVEDGTQIQSFVVKPPGFDPGRRYPALMLIHGGPQGEWGESWSYRWNAQVFAAAGYVVVMPNPHGSIGYGQAFTDAVNRDWGGKPYDDIMAVTDKVSKLPYVNPDRLVAAGGSYGGYMIDWILGHTTRFKALITHDGVFDLRSEAGETEELWFPFWEFGGTPWDNPEMYIRWSPSQYVKEFKTPTLVIHGELDYRVPIGQGLQLFTALQIQKVPSQLLIFPDEGHWVLKPQNSMLWYKTFVEWIDHWTRQQAEAPPAPASAPTPPSGVTSAPKE